MRKKEASFLSAITSFILVAIIIGTLAFLSSSLRILVIIIEGIFAAEEIDGVWHRWNDWRNKFFNKFTKNNKEEKRKWRI